MNKQIIELIDNENKKVLKNANTVCFRLNENGQSVIECSKKINVDGFETEVRKSINVGTRLENYERFGKESSRDYKIIKGFSSINYALDDLNWQTIVKNLKKDDEIYLYWLAGNNCQFLDEANMSNDMLHLIIKRKEKNHMQFLVDTLVTSKHSLARMIKFEKNI